jgi:hypothetical protein
MRIKNIKKAKKGQSEIVGITLVMVLVMLGIIFVISYVVLPESTNIKQNYDQAQVAANFMDALLKTTTECNSLTITELIQDCAEHQDTMTGIYMCPETDLCSGVCNSCEYLNLSMKYIFDSSLNKMPQVNYDLYICKWDHANAQCYGELISDFQNSDCKDNTKWPKGYESKQQPIPTGVGNRVMQMYVC